MSDTCSAGKCVCGSNLAPCKEKLSSHCIEGLCKCGTNAQCGQPDPERISLLGYDALWPKEQEICEMVTPYYNPLYVKDKLYNKYGILLSFDDGKGKHIKT